MIKLLFLNFLFLIFPELTIGKVTQVDIQLDSPLAAPRWEFGDVKVESLNFPAKNLANIKTHFNNRDFKNCLKEISIVESKVLSLKPWLTFMALRCSQDIKDLSKWVEVADTNYLWWTLGGHEDSLVKEYIKSRIKLFSLYISDNKNLAWKEFDKLLGFSELMSTDQLSEIYKMAGNLAFVQQNIVLAYEYLTRSLRLKNNGEVNIKIQSLRQLLLDKKLITLPKDKEEKTIVIELEASENENQHYELMQVALNAGDLVPAITDGIKILKNYPSGLRAQNVQKQLLQIYLNYINKPEDKYKTLISKFKSELFQIPSDVLLKWGKYLFEKGYHEHVIEFLQEVNNRKENLNSISEVNFLIGQSYIYIGDYKKAISFFEKAMLSGAGSDFFEKSLFLTGLSYFQTGDYSASTSQFEKLIASRSKTDFIVSANYWLWRSLQFLDEKRALEVGKNLFGKFPLTYYGLRARFEIEGKGIDWLNKSNSPTSLSLHLSDSETKAFEIAKLLLQAGWFEEARAELSLLPKVYLPKSKLIMANIWNWSFDHFQSISLLNEVWESNPELLNLDNLKIGFPKEFRFYIEKYSALNSVDKNLIWALIRQESSFRINVTSPAGALGLMQLMPPTAREVSQRLKLPLKQIPEDVFSPENNIRMGISYISQLMRAFNGHLPLTIAAYNVGIGNIRKWTNLRPDFDKQSQLHSSHFRNEIWIDELPWSETSYYIKSVLRNLIIYRMITHNTLELNDPIWK